MQSGGSSAPTPPWVAYNADRTDFIEADLTGLTNGSYLFYDFSSLTSFSRALTALTTGREMFHGCVALVIFTSGLPALIIGISMFYGCRALASFTSALTALTDGSYMFANCFALTIFTSALTALTKGDLMFAGCKLDKDSSLLILNTIPAYTSGTHSLTLGMASALNGDADIAAALTAASAKGWTVTAQYN